MAGSPSNGRDVPGVRAGFRDRSTGDRLSALREKTEEYLANRVQLGWLIDPIQKTVAIYRPAGDSEVLMAPKIVKGEGCVEGFVLDLDGIL